MTDSKRCSRYVLAVVVLMGLGACQKEGAGSAGADNGGATVQTAVVTKNESTANDPIKPSENWRLVLVDSANHVLAPLPETSAKCDATSAGPLPAEGTPYLAIKLEDAVLPKVDETLWPKERDWAVAKMDGSVSMTRLSHRVGLMSEAYAGCQYLTTQSVATGATPGTGIGSLDAAIAFAPSAKRDTVRRAMGKRFRANSGQERWTLSDAQTKALIQQLAGAAQTSGVPADYKSSWPQIAERPKLVSAVQERRNGKESRLVLVVWSLPDDEGQRQPFWMLARISDQVDQVIAAPALDPKVNYFYAPELEGVVDVDGDGNDELIISAGYYEGHQYLIWSLAGDKVTSLAESPYFGL